MKYTLSLSAFGGWVWQHGNGSAILALVLLLALSSPVQAAPRRWSAWTEGVIASSDPGHKALTLVQTRHRGPANFSWDDRTHQWDGRHLNAKGKAVDPAVLTIGAQARVLYQKQGPGFKAMRIILLSPSPVSSPSAARAGRSPLRALSE